jgi:hypothetical protein
MKYPLAIIDRMLRELVGKLGIGYDIMCAFWKTLLRSRLGNQVIKSGVRGVVPAFHGHAHNRKCQVSKSPSCDFFDDGMMACQVRWHPQYTVGVGLEDFETCERTFSASNALAGATRLATPFHRRQEILEHFNFQDEDKLRLTGGA